MRYLLYMRTGSSKLIVALLFLLSGFAALIYQAAWQRLLVVFAGGDVHSITIIVTVFMAGLGIGSLAGGSLADRSSAFWSLVWFAAAEAGIAIFGLCSKPLIYDMLYVKTGSLAVSRVTATALIAAILIVPTVLMGMSLPLLAKAMIRGLADAAAVTGRLYGANTLGAACGALAATWAFIPLHGIEGAIRWAAALNLMSALMVVPLLWLGKPAPAAQTAPDRAEAAASSNGDENWSLRMCLLICCLSGFLALALEIVWFRLLGVMLKSTAFTFGTLLAIYLAGIGLGSLAGMMIAGRSRRPARAFLWMQCGIGMYAGLVLAAVLAAVTFWPPLATVREYLDSYEPIDANSAVRLIRKWMAGTLRDSEKAVVWIFPALHLALPLLMIGPPTFVMGLSYPHLQKAVHSDLAWVGRRTGWVQSANIAGCLLGSVLASAALLPLLGTAGTMRLLVVAAGAFGLLAAWRARLKFAAVLAATAAALAIMPGHADLWARAHGSTAEKIRLAEDGSGVSVLKLASEKSKPAVEAGVFVNGLGQSFIPFGGVHSMLGALPAMLHPRPERIMVIGLGSGDTAFSAAGRPETVEVICPEIIGSQIETLREHAAAVEYPPLRICLTDPRIRHLQGDGRRILLSTQQRFDIIEADALRPTSAHSGTLYSEEYFRLLSSRLKPGGFAVTWNPTQRVNDTFIKVFPHVLRHESVLIGSNDPFQIDSAALQLRARQPEIADYYRKAGIDIVTAIDTFVKQGLAGSLTGPEFDRSGLADVNTDLFPRDEFGMTALWQPSKRKKPAKPSASQAQ